MKRPQRKPLVTVDRSDKSDIDERDTVTHVKVFAHPPEFDALYPNFVPFYKRPEAAKIMRGGK